MTMTVPTNDMHGMSVAEFDTTKFLSHASAQARERHLEKYFIVDVDSHHYETTAYKDIVKYLDDPVLRHQAKAAMTGRGDLTSILGVNLGNQEMSGRIMRSLTRRLEKTPGHEPRDVTISRRWMDAMGVDVSMLFPTPMLNLGTNPNPDISVKWARAYNRWMVEEILPHDSRIRSMLYLPFNDPDATYAMIEEFADKKGVSGFMVTATHNQAVHANSMMKSYAALQERDLPIAFHGIYNGSDSAFSTMNRFISVHALGFVFYNMLHCINWIINGLPERFPKLKVIWMESGLAWIPFLMQRLDNEYALRSNEAPLLKMKPSEYMQQMFYTSQPCETQNIKAMELTFEMINAKTQLLYSSDYPHWDFDLPSVIYDLPFLDEQAKRNILGENARRVFNIKETGKLAQIPAAL